MRSDQTHVLIAGGGVAALEAATALQHLAPDVVDVRLLAPEEFFSYRPLSVTLPFDSRAEVVRYELSELAADLGASVVRGALTGIDSWRHLAHTSTNRDLEYDVLLVACGALAMPALDGALTFRGSVDADNVRQLLDELARNEIRSIAFVVPPGPVWPLPAYELALLAGWHADSRAELWLVTPEMEPLQVFGPEASEAVRQLLVDRGVTLRSGVYAQAFVEGRLELLPHDSLLVDRIVALPRLAGAPIDGIPQTIDGFIPVDDHGRVRGFADVYAAGDIASFPIKHGGLATQQALVAAEMIAANAGSDLEPRAFRPVLHGLLLTGSEPRFLRRELDGIAEHEPMSAIEPLWWPPAKIAGRYLGPFLASRLGDVATQPEHVSEGHAVEVPLRPELLEGLVLRVPSSADEFDGPPELADLLSMDICVVSPEDTLGEVAERLLQSDLSAALVSEYGRLIGILTIQDLIGAFASRAHPSEARARQWMTAEPITLDTRSSRTGAASLMRAHGIHHLPLVDDGRPVGMLRLTEDRVGALPIGLGL